MRWLLDTCALSEWVRPRPHAGVVAWLDAQEPGALWVSAISLAELERGVVQLRTRDATRARRLARWLTKLRERFAEHTLPVDDATLQHWARLAGEAAAKGRTLPVLDALIAATAVRHGLTVVTRNLNAFEGAAPVFHAWELPG